ncbi:MAG TPA: DUF5698 domain-containing protein [Gemmataceae bacterium]|nr:DUF5698 domain-containing protein [Gemmataceae bacterium]
MGLFLHSMIAGLSPLPLMVFVAELCVVTISTMRIIFVSRGMKVLAPILGFFEVSIWLFAIGQIMQNLSDVGCYLAFAGGFTIGNFLGVLIEKKLAIGNAVVRVITPRDVTALLDALQTAEYGVTTLDARGGTGPVKMVLTAVRRKELDKVVAIIKEFDANAFYSVDDLQSLAAGIFPSARGRVRAIVPGPLRLFRFTA